MIDPMKQAQLEILVSEMGELGELAYDIIHSHLDAARNDFIWQAKERYASHFAGDRWPTVEAYLKTVTEVFDEELDLIVRDKAAPPE